MEVEGHEDKFFTSPFNWLGEQMAGGGRLAEVKEEGDQVLYHSS